MLKKTVSLFLIVGLLLSCVIIPCSAAAEASGGRNENGFIAPIDDPDAGAIEISTAEGLLSIANNLYGSYVLTANIDMSGHGNWEPVGKTLASAFHGKLDGQGHTIRGLTVAVDFNSATLMAPYYAVGLFGVCDGAQVKNLILEDVDISVNTTSGYRYDYSIIDSAGTVFAGGIVGYAKNETVLFNSSVSGKISAGASGEGYSPTVSGGLAGFLDSSVVSFCYNNASVDSYNGNVSVAENGYAGGLVGRIETEAVIDRSYNNGAVTSRVLDYGVSYAGGLVAEAAGSVSIENSFNSGEIKSMSGNNFSDPAYAGGIAAAFNGSVSMCYNSGLVTAQIADPWGINSVSAFAGGICGNSTANTSITACSINNPAVYVSTSGAKYQNRISNGGIKSNNISTDTYAQNSNTDANNYYSVEELKSAAVYANVLGWNFAKTWQMVEGVDFPQLKQVDANSDAYHEEYIQQHLNFIQNGKYREILDHHRWAKTYWSRENNFASNAGGALYQTTDSLVKLSQLKLGDIFDQDDPFVLILGDYVSNHKVEQTVNELYEMKVPLALDEKFSKVSKFIKDHWENAWGDLSDEDLFYLYHYDEKTSDQWISEHFEDHLEEIVAPSKKNMLADAFNVSTEVVDSFMEAKNKYNSVVHWINDFTAYAANVKAYVDASVEFHTILEMMQSNLPSGTALESYYKLKLGSALLKYTQYNSEAFLTARIFLNYRIDCAVASFKKNLKKTLNSSMSDWVKSCVSDAAFSKLNTIGWFAEKTWSICEYVTKNGELQECREMLKANAYFEETVYRTLRAVESQFRMTQSFEDACLFDAAFKFLKETEICSMDTVIKYMDTYQTSWLQSIRNLSNTFMNSAIEEVHINKLYLNNTYCHGYSYALGGKVITVACPTDVFLYDDSDQLLASVEGNLVSYSSSDMLVYTTDSVKLFAVPAGQSYHIRIVATDNGTMSYSVSDYDEHLNNTNSTLYASIPIASGDCFNGEITDSEGDQPNTYSITDSQNMAVGGSVVVNDENNVPVESVTIDPPKTIMRVGETMQCGACVSPDNATIKSVAWVSSSPQTATVSSDGKVTALQEGVSTISVQSIYGGAADFREIIVISDERSLLVTKEPQDNVYSLGENAVELSFSYYQADDHPVNVQWYCADDDSSAGEPINGGNTAKYTPPTDHIGVKYYYAQVSDGAETVVTRRAKITVVAEKIIASGEGNGFSWELTEHMRLSVSGVGELTAEDGGAAPWDEYSGAIKEIVFSDGITFVGKEFLQNCTQLEKAVFPDSVTAFDEGTLSACGSLSELTIPFVGTSRDALRTKDAVLGILFGIVSEGGVVQYYNVSGTSLSGYRYAIPVSLKKVTVTDANKLSFGAFQNCSSIVSVELNEGLTEIDENAFSNCSAIKALTLPDSLQKTGASMLRGCNALESLSLPFVGKTRSSDNSSEAVLGWLFGTDANGVQQYLSLSGTSVSINRFAIPAALKRITLTSAQIVPFGAFSNCSQLESVHLNSGIERIGGYAFLNCKGILSLAIPDSVRVIDEDSLNGCNSLQRLSVPFVGSCRTANGTFDGAFGYIFGRTSESATNYCVQYAILDGSSLSGYGYAIPDSLTEIAITDASQIPVGAFCNMSHLKELYLNAEVSKIELYAFFGADEIDDIYFKAKKSVWNGIEKGMANDVLDTATIHCFPDFPIGDVNLDGVINIRDVTAIQRHLAEIKTLSFEQLCLSDTTGDNNVSISDATLLQMYLAEYDVTLGQ